MVALRAMCKVPCGGASESEPGIDDGRIDIPSAGIDNAGVPQTVWGNDSERHRFSLNVAIGFVHFYHDLALGELYGRIPGLHPHDVCARTLVHAEATAPIVAHRAGQVLLEVRARGYDLEVFALEIRAPNQDTQAGNRAGITTHFPVVVGGCPSTVDRRLVGHQARRRLACGVVSVARAHSARRLSAGSSHLSAC